MLRKQRSMSIFAHAMILLAASAHAAEERLIEEVQIIGEPADASQIAGSAFVLTELDLEKFEYTDIHRIVRQVPGVYFQEEDGYGLRPSLGIRGSGSGRSSRITLMEDGVLIAPAPYAAPEAYYFPSSGRMVGVEVLKGPQTLRHGPYTVGGAINLISAKIPDQAAGLAMVEVGEDSEQRSHLRYGATQGQLGFVVESFQHQSQGFNDIDRSNRDTGFDKEDYLAKLRWTSAAGARYAQQLELKLNYAEEVSNDSYLGVTDSQFKRDPYRRYGITEVDQMNTRQSGAVLRHKIAFSDSLELSSMVYRNDFERSWFKVASAGGTSISNLIAQANGGDTNSIGILEGNVDVTDVRVKDNAREYYGEGVQFELAGNFATGSVAHEWLLGARRHSDEADRFQPTTVYNQVNGSLAFDSIIQPGSGDNRLDEADALALWAQNRMSMGALDVTLSLRSEDVETESTRYSSLDRSTVASSRDNDVDDVLAGLGATYSLGESWQILAGVHEGFAPPGGGAVGGTEPEESTNYEFGTRYRDDRSSLDIIAFYSDYKNTVNNCSVANPCTGARSFGTESLGEAEVRGLEISASTVLLSTPHFTMPVLLSYTHTDAEITKDSDTGNVLKGDNLQYLPDNVTHVSLGLEGTGGWNAYISSTFISSMCVDNRCERGLDNNFRKTDSYLTVDLSASVPVTESVDLFARVDNLLDDESIVARSPAGARVNKPRTGYLGARLRF